MRIQPTWHVEKIKKNNLPKEISNSIKQLLEGLLHLAGYLIGIS